MLDLYNILDATYSNSFKRIYQTLVKINKKLVQNIVLKRKINLKISLHNRYKKSHKDFYEIAQKNFFIKEIYNILKKKIVFNYLRYYFLKFL